MAGLCVCCTDIWQAYVLDVQIILVVLVYRSQNCSSVYCTDRPCGVGLQITELSVYCTDRPCGVGLQITELRVYCTDRRCGVGLQITVLRVYCTDRPCGVGPHMAGLYVYSTDRFGTILLVHKWQRLYIYSTDRFETVLLIHTWQDYVFTVQIDLELCCWSTLGRTMCLQYR